MPRYSKEFIGEIKTRLRVSDVVGKFVKLTQRGNEFVGLSPFKNEKTPSFTVNDEKEFFHCFSSAEHGDIFSFLMKHKNMSYPESIEYLANQAGLNPETGIIRDPNYVEKDFSSLRKIINEANRYFKDQLNASSEYLMCSSPYSNMIESVFCDELISKSMTPPKMISWFDSGSITLLKFLIRGDSLVSVVSLSAPQDVRKITANMINILYV